MTVRVQAKELSVSAQEPQPFTSFGNDSHPESSNINMIQLFFN